MSTNQATTTKRLCLTNLTYCHRAVNDYFGGLDCLTNRLVKQNNSRIKMINEWSKELHRS